MRLDVACLQKGLIGESDTRSPDVLYFRLGARLRNSGVLAGPGRRRASDGHRVRGRGHLRGEGKGIEFLDLGAEDAPASSAKQARR